MKKTVLILLFIVFCVGSAKQEELIYDAKIHLSLFPTLNYFTTPRADVIDEQHSFGYGFTSRIMWQPGRALSLGIMFGYMELSRDKIDDYEASASLMAIPLQAVLALGNEDLEFGFGMGPYLLLSDIDYGNSANSYRFELGLTFIGNYYWELNDDLRLGFENKLLYLSFRGVLTVMPSLNLRYNFLRY